MEKLHDLKQHARINGVPLSPMEARIAELEGYVAELRTHLRAMVVLAANAPVKHPQQTAQRLAALAILGDQA